MTKRIGLVGYFKWGNYGDELFRQVLADLFAGDEDIEVDVMHDMTVAPYFSTSVEERVAQFDAVIIGGGDLIIPWMLSPLYWKEEYLAKPVYIVGVEVPRWGGWDENVCKQMAAFFQHENVKFIHTRSQVSAEWIKKHLRPSVDVYPGVDIVCAMDFPFNSPQNKVLGLITRANQNLNPVNINAFLQKAVDAGWSIKHIPLGTAPTADDDIAEAHEHTFTPRSITVANTIEELTREIQSCQLLLSMKFHGCVVGHMSGVPTITLSRADKFVHFYNRIGREAHMAVAPDETLPERFYPGMAGVDRDAVFALRAESKKELGMLRQQVLEELK
ncbi:MAG: polysaccharide pyruvyl transferase family protein [Rhodobacterales bacterium]|nr:polysaccharide pyruvyl transferase family protein [Rhodobacterales bacterium]